MLDYYNDYFGVKYPLPKLDLIALPGGFGGAMENWGGITFFESRLLFDPTTSADTAKRGIFSVLAHEMAHQWFGDLVTMGWWDNLWLNEGFASWMQEKAAEHFYPQWHSWLNGYGQKQYAMALDARRTSHPIQQRVRRPERGDDRVRRHHLQQGSGPDPDAGELSRRRRRFATAFAATWPRMPMATPPPPISGRRWKPRPASR